VSASHDRKFFDTFMMILGMLVAVAVALIILARIIAGNATDMAKAEDPVYRQEIAQRIQPVARVAVAGEDNSALAPAQAEPVAMADLSGEEAFNQACAACHGAGIAGAPKYGDPSAWSARIGQGIETLNKHALEGYQGKDGYMPPKGGRTDLSDQSVLNAVDYIVAGSK
jgi:cytochrome c5